MALREKKICILVPVFDRREYLVSLMKDLELQESQSFSLLIVDHGVHSQEIDPGVHGYPVQVHRASPDLWYTGAINVGISHILSRQGLTEHILLMNDDVSLPPSYIKGIEQCLQDHTGGNIVLGSSDIDQYGKVKEFNIQFNWYTANRHRPWKGHDISEIPDGMHASDVLNGRGTLYPVQVFREIGLLNAHCFKQYGSDYEISRRASKHGYELLLNKNVHLSSNIESTGLNPKHRKLTLSQVLRSYFAINSPHYLLSKPCFAYKMVPGIFHFIPFLVSDFLRGVIGPIRALFR